MELAETLHINGRLLVLEMPWSLSYSSLHLCCSYSLQEYTGHRKHESWGCNVTGFVYIASTNDLASLILSLNLRKNSKVTSYNCTRESGAQHMLQISENNAFSTLLLSYVEHYTLFSQKNLQLEQKDMQKILVNYEITCRNLAHHCREKDVIWLSLIYVLTSINLYSETGANWSLDSNCSFFQHWVLKLRSFHGLKLTRAGQQTRLGAGFIICFFIAKSKFSTVPIKVFMEKIILELRYINKYINK